eukprot:TRINITY_DN2315_c0_g3_i1.p1 TRINITY_DN2315_c0_g3~~TRINITY_DN2315_c0_g3_i1.p1  ORF type:complete len:851 (-),score=154.13 TRINITY_DN2315_c0_g3_i1:33-2585(-)
MGLMGLNGASDVALEGVHVEAKILDMVAEVNVLQFYFNELDVEIEAKYVFPLDHNSAVCDFQAEVNGNIIQGRVKEKQEARRDYEDAVQRGDRAYLLEKNLPDVFQVLVGNIPPKTRCTIKLTYIVELSNAGGEGGDEAKSIQFLLPTAVAPRYSPKASSSLMSRWLSSLVDERSSDRYPWYNSFPDSFHWNRYITTTSETGFYASNTMVLKKRPYALSLYIEAEMLSSIVQISSSTHPIQYHIRDDNDDKKKKRNATIMFVQDSESMDKDVVINILTSEHNQPRAIYEEPDVMNDNNSENKAEGAMMLTLVPEFVLDELNDCEFVFVVDQSGSMSGSKMESVKNALQLLLRSLPCNCKFNIIGFGSTFVSLFPQTVPYSDDNISTAAAAVSKMTANLGGTEILRPLQFVYDDLNLNNPSHVQIFVLTDGEVSNTEDVLREVAKNHKNNASWRLFTIGVGDSVSHALVDGMAREGRGTSQFIKLGEKIEPKIMSQLKHALQPGLSNVRVHWGVPKGDTKQAPQDIPPIYSGSRFIAYAFIDPAAPIPTELHLKAESPDGPLSITLPVERTCGSFVHKLAARSRIRDLEQKSNYFCKNEAVSLGCRYKLVSKYTSFVAVEALEQEPIDPIVAACLAQNLEKILNRGCAIENLVEQSEQLEVESYHFKRTAEKLRRDMSITSRISSWFSSWFDSGADATQSDPVGSSYNVVQAESLTAAVPSAVSPEPKSSVSTSTSSTWAPPSNALQQLVSYQSSNGSFHPSHAVASLLNIDASRLEQPPTSFAATTSASGVNLNVVWTTAVVVAFIEKHLKTQKDEWDLLVQKAKKWIQQQLKDMNVDASEFLRQATTLV